MGKTGSTTWAQVKGVKGQIRLVSNRFSDIKKPGPNQRYKQYSTLKKIEKTESQRPQFRGRRGRGRGSGADPRVRKRLPRSKKSAMGVKKR